MSSVPVLMVQWCPGKVEEAGADPDHQGDREMYIRPGEVDPTQ